MQAKSHNSARGRARQSATVGLALAKLPYTACFSSPRAGAVKASRLAGRTRRRTAGSRSNRRRLLKENRVLLSDSSGQLIRIGDLTSHVREPGNGVDKLPVAQVGNEAIHGFSLLCRYSAISRLVSDTAPLSDCRSTISARIRRWVGVRWFGPFFLPASIHFGHLSGEKSAQGSSTFCRDSSTGAMSGIAPSSCGLISIPHSLATAHAICAFLPFN